MMKKRGRKPKENERKVRVLVSLDPDLLRLVDAFARAFSTTRAGAIREMIRTATQPKTEAADAPID